ncbi:ABC transporter ATP-binding protein [bacterium]|nr:ABC transporter ATP-binding protein [bacterium]
MNKIEINISNLIKDFKSVRALDNVSMHFETGRLYGVIGPAGAGKTTLFRIMLHLMQAGAGDIEYLVDGRKTKFADFSGNIAYMPQSQSLYADLSVAEHLDFFKQLYGISDAEFKSRTQELLQLTRLEKFLDRPAGNLSGGMYKKLGLMCALLRSPRVMLLDEPTNGVDPISRREFWSLLHASLSKGMLIILTTAYMDEAERCSDVVLMESGRVLDTGAPVDLLRQYDVRNFDELFLVRGGVR